VPAKDASKLTEKQKRFCAEYLVDLNATAAYKRAGYAGQGNTAEVNASKLLRTAKVCTEIAAQQKRLQEKTGITQERVLAEYAKLAFLDPRRFYDDGGALIPVHSLPADVAAALAGMEVTVARSGTDEDGKPEYEDVKKIKFIDKKGALDSIARHLGMFVDKTELSGPNGGPQQHEHKLDISAEEAYRRMIEQK
jgi:phage terminase small subunit